MADSPADTAAAATAGGAEIEVEELTESGAMSCLGTIGTRFCYEI
ncbi:hypothetical protein [Streptomyces bambusae]|nr:hypothetical protein [Streptomyces bambusae]